jgi:hypothetical protein
MENRNNAKTVNVVKTTHYHPSGLSIDFKISDISISDFNLTDILLQRK